MSCARIRNKPVKFLDPQEKLILDLREEIKRLKVENTKLRSTIVTAPVFGGKGQVGQRLDIDADILVVPRSISAQDKVLYHSSTVHGAMRGGGKNKKAIKKGIKQKSVVGVNRRLPFVLPRNDKGDDDSLDSEDASSSYSHGSRIRNAHLQVEDVIRRHVTGPMVLKGKDVAPMFRIQTDENDLYGGGYGQYRSPKSHTSEEARIRMLEDKIARIEQLTVGAAAANNK